MRLRGEGMKLLKAVGLMFKAMWIVLTLPFYALKSRN